MIKRLRIKFIAITMGVLLIVFAIVFLTLNVFMQTSSARQTEYLLQTVAEQDGFPLPQKGNSPQREDPSHSSFMPDPEMMRAGRFFYVKLNEDDEAIEMNFEMMFDFTQEQALAFAASALNSGRSSGTLDNLRYLVVEKHYGKIVAFAERSIETQMLAQLIQVSLWIAGAHFPFCSFFLYSSPIGP
jgi:hypothetical protein